MCIQKFCLPIKSKIWRKIFKNLLPKQIGYAKLKIRGGLAERSKAPVLKTGEVQAS